MTLEKKRRYEIRSKCDDMCNHYEKAFDHVVRCSTIFRSLNKNGNGKKFLNDFAKSLERDKMRTPPIV